MGMIPMSRTDIIRRLQPDANKSMSIACDKTVPLDRLNVKMINIEATQIFAEMINTSFRFFQIPRDDYS